MADTGQASSQNPQKIQTRLVNLVDLGIPRTRGHGAIVLFRLEVDGVGRARYRAEAARHALLQPVLVAHEHLLAAVLRKHRDLLVRIVHRDRLLEHVLERGGEPGEEGSNHLKPMIITMPSVLEEPKFLSADQFLVTTLMVKLAVMAVLATMLARFRQFRHILIFERRGWTDRLVFALAIGLPLMAGVTARLLLNYNAADLTLEGAFLAGLIAGPYTGATVGVLVGVPAFIAGEFIAIIIAVGAGFAGGGLREACPKEAIWQFTPFVFIDLPKHVWHMLRRLEPNWQLALLAPPIALELLRQALGTRFSVHRLFYLDSMEPWMTALVVLVAVARSSRHPDQNLEQRPHRAQAAGTGEAPPRREDRGAQEPNQSAFPFQYARVNLLAHPIPAGYGAHPHHQALRTATTPDAKPSALRHAARSWNR